MDVTLCVCTRNRRRQLEVLLTSLTQVVVPDDVRLDMLVVDNGSTDGTTELVEAYRDRLPVRCVVETQPGVAHARNRVIDEVRGEYALFIDDDVEVDSGWLRAYVDAFRRHPDDGLFGGRISPMLEAPTPRWFARLAHLWPVSDLLAMRDFGDAELRLTFEGDLTPWGANMAIRTRDLRTVRFDVNLGPSPFFRRTGEETDLVFQLMRKGVTGWWVPDARVKHHIVSSRQSRGYFYRYYFAIGETLAYLRTVRPVNYMSPDGQPREEVAGPAWFLYARTGFQLALFAAFHLLGLTRRSLYHLRRAAMHNGGAAFKRQASRSPQTAELALNVGAG